MLKNLLESCGLNVSEQAVVVCLLERGRSIASVIAKATGLKRPTVYAALANLQDYGLVLRRKAGAVTYFALVNLKLIPGILESRAEQKYEKVQRATAQLGKQLNEMVPQQQADLGGFGFEQMESVEGVYAQLEDALMGGDFCGIFNPQKAIVSQQGKDVVKRFLGSTGKSQPHIREIVVAGPMATWYQKQIENPNHLVKEIAAESKLVSDMIFVNGAVFVIHYDPQKEVAVKMTHPDYYQSMVTVFEMLWKGLGEN